MLVHLLQALSGSCITIANESTNTSPPPPTRPPRGGIHLIALNKHVVFLSPYLLLSTSPPLLSLPFLLLFVFTLSLLFQRLRLFLLLFFRPSSLPSSLCTSFSFFSSASLLSPTPLEVLAPRPAIFSPYVSFSFPFCHILLTSLFLLLRLTLFSLYLLILSFLLAPASYFLFPFPVPFLLVSRLLILPSPHPVPPSFQNIFFSLFSNTHKIKRK